MDPDPSPFPLGKLLSGKSVFTALPDTQGRRRFKYVPAF